MRTYTARFLTLVLLLGTVGSFGGEASGPDSPARDVCQGHAYGFVTQDEDSLGVTFADCTASERGE